MSQLWVSSREFNKGQVRRWSLYIGRQLYARVIMSKNQPMQYWTSPLINNDRNLVQGSAMSEVLRVIIEQAVSQGQTNSGLRDNRNPRNKVLYGIADIYVEQVLDLFKSHLDELLSELPKEAGVPMINGKELIAGTGFARGFNQCLTQITNQIKEYRYKI